MTKVPAGITPIPVEIHPKGDIAQKIINSNSNFTQRRN